jgi:hypothetical protein
MVAGHDGKDYALAATTLPRLDGGDLGRMSTNAAVTGVESVSLTPQWKAFQSSLCDNPGI